MSYKLWKDQRDTFELLDLRGRIDNVLTELTEMAAETRKGQGIHVIQSFRPIMYYGPMSKLGFEYHTEQKGNEEFHIYFCPSPFQMLAMHPRCSDVDLLTLVGAAVLAAKREFKS